MQESCRRVALDYLRSYWAVMYNKFWRLTRSIITYAYARQSLSNETFLRQWSRYTHGVRICTSQRLLSPQFPAIANRKYSKTILRPISFEDGVTICIQRPRFALNINGLLQLAELGSRPSVVLHQSPFNRLSKVFLREIKSCNTTQLNPCCIT